MVDFPGRTVSFREGVSTYPSHGMNLWGFWGPFFLEVRSSHEQQVRSTRCLLAACVAYWVHMGVSKNRGGPQNGWFIMENRKILLKWMNWGYHYSWKHPYGCIISMCCLLFYLSSMHAQKSESFQGACYYGKQYPNWMVHVHTSWIMELDYGTSWRYEHWKGPGMCSEYWAAVTGTRLLLPVRHRVLFGCRRCYHRHTHRALAHDKV